MLSNNLPCGHSRAFNIGVELFGLDDPVVRVEGVLAAEGADLILLTDSRVSKGKKRLSLVSTYLNLLAGLGDELQFLRESRHGELGGDNILLRVATLGDEVEHRLAHGVGSL